MMNLKREHPHIASKESEEASGLGQILYFLLCAILGPFSTILVFFTIREHDWKLELLISICFGCVFTIIQMLCIGALGGKKTTYSQLDIVLGEENYHVEMKVGAYLHSCEVDDFIEKADPSVLSYSIGRESGKITKKCPERSKDGKLKYVSHCFTRVNDKAILDRLVKESMALKYALENKEELCKESLVYSQTLRNMVYDKISAP